MKFILNQKSLGKGYYPHNVDGPHPIMIVEGLKKKKKTELQEEEKI